MVLVGDGVLGRGLMREASAPSSRGFAVAAARPRPRPRRRRAPAAFALAFAGGFFRFGFEPGLGLGFRLGFERLFFGSSSIGGRRPCAAGGKAARGFRRCAPARRGR